MAGFGIHRWIRVPASRFHPLAAPRSGLGEGRHLGRPVATRGGYVVFWSDNRWVTIKIPTGARSLSYRWGRAVAFLNEDIEAKRGMRYCRGFHASNPIIPSCPGADASA